ncbi:MAG: hypothetical protein A3I83_06535 [Methylotenera sp. RIFCSPLOWO2_02_FULL_45_14]|nr:MAG: hypothetical protein A3I83_06535 [Methylotenera sp. RIFCSPLOWO2_02_FULL_45_14]
MRYYLAIDAYLSALNALDGNQLIQRLRQWHQSTDEYSRQLHEGKLDDYLVMKLSEYQRQQVFR